MNAKGMQDYPHEVAKIAATTDHFNERGIVAIADMMVFTRPYDHLRMYRDAEAEEEFFSRDDAHRVVGMLHKGSEALEWSPALEEQPGTARDPTTPAPSDNGSHAQDAPLVVREGAKGFGRVGSPPGDEGGLCVLAGAVVREEVP